MESTSTVETQLEDDDDVVLVGVERRRRRRRRRPPIVLTLDDDDDDEPAPPPPKQRVVPVPQGPSGPTFDMDCEDVSEENPVMVVEAGAGEKIMEARKEVIEIDEDEEEEDVMIVGTSAVNKGVHSSHAQEPGTSEPSPRKARGTGSEESPAKEDPLRVFTGILGSLVKLKTQKEAEERGKSPSHRGSPRGSTASPQSASSPSAVTPGGNRRARREPIPQQSPSRSPGFGRHGAPPHIQHQYQAAQQNVGMQGPRISYMPGTRVSGMPRQLFPPPGAQPRYIPPQEGPMVRNVRQPIQVRGYPPRGIPNMPQNQGIPSGYRVPARGGMTPTMVHSAGPRHIQGAPMAPNIVRHPVAGSTGPLLPTTPSTHATINTSHPATNQPMLPRGPHFNRQTFRHQGQTLEPVTVDSGSSSPEIICLEDNDASQISVVSEKNPPPESSSGNSLPPEMSQTPVSQPVNMTEEGQNAPASSSQQVGVPVTEPAPQYGAIPPQPPVSHSRPSDESPTQVNSESAETSQPFDVTSLQITQVTSVQVTSPTSTQSQQILNIEPVVSTAEVSQETSQNVTVEPAQSTTPQSESSGYTTPLLQGVVPLTGEADTLAQPSGVGEIDGEASDLDHFEGGASDGDSVCETPKPIVGELQVKQSPRESPEYGQLSPKREEKPCLLTLKTEVVESPVGDYLVREQSEEPEYMPEGSIRLPSDMRLEPDHLAMLQTLTTPSVTTSEQTLAIPAVPTSQQTQVTSSVTTGQQDVPSHQGASLLLQQMASEAVAHDQTTTSQISQGAPVLIQAPPDSTGITYPSLPQPSSIPVTSVTSDSSVATLEAEKGSKKHVAKASEGKGGPKKGRGRAWQRSASSDSDYEPDSQTTGKTRQAETRSSRSETTGKTRQSETRSSRRQRKSKENARAAIARSLSPGLDLDSSQEESPEATRKKDDNECGSTVQDTDTGANEVIPGYAGIPPEGALGNFGATLPGVYTLPFSEQITTSTATSAMTFTSVGSSYPVTSQVSEPGWFQSQNLVPPCAEFMDGRVQAPAAEQTPTQAQEQAPLEKAADSENEGADSGLTKDQLDMILKCESALARLREKYRNKAQSKKPNYKAKTTKQSGVSIKHTAKKHRGAAKPTKSTKTSQPTQRTPVVTRSKPVTRGPSRLRQTASRLAVEAEKSQAAAKKTGQPKNQKAASKSPPVQAKKKAKKGSHWTKKRVTRVGSFFKKREPRIKRTKDTSDESDDSEPKKKVAKVGRPPKKKEERPKKTKDLSDVSSESVDAAPTKVSSKGKSKSDSVPKQKPDESTPKQRPGDTDDSVDESASTKTKKVGKSNDLEGQPEVILSRLEDSLKMLSKKKPPASLSGSSVQIEDSDLPDSETMSNASGDGNGSKDLSVTTSNDVTLDDLPSESLWQELEQRGAVYRCQCGHAFKAQAMYYLHRNCHNMTNPFQCGICNRTFTDWYNFTSHYFNH